MIKVTKEEAPADKETLTITLKSEKVKEGEAFEPFTLSLVRQVCCVGPDSELERTESLVIKPNSQVARQRVVRVSGSHAEAEVLQRRALSAVLERMSYSASRPSSMSLRELTPLLRQCGAIDFEADKATQRQQVRRIKVAMMKAQQITIRDDTIFIGSGVENEGLEAGNNVTQRDTTY